EGVRGAGQERWTEALPGPRAAGLRRARSSAPFVAQASSSTGSGATGQRRARAGAAFVDARQMAGCAHTRTCGARGPERRRRAAIAFPENDLPRQRAVLPLGAARARRRLLVGLAAEEAPAPEVGTEEGVGVSEGVRRNFVLSIVGCDSEAVLRIR